MWRLIKYFAEAGEPRERAEPQPPPARCSLPGGGAGWAGSAPRLASPRLGSPGLGRALPQPSHRTTRLLPVDRALRRPVPPSPPKSGTVSSLPCAPTHQSQAGREDGAGRAGAGLGCQHLMLQAERHPLSPSPRPEAGCPPGPEGSPGAGRSPPPAGSPGRSPLSKFVSGACCGSQVKKPVCKQPPASCPGGERRRGFVSAAQNPPNSSKLS